MCMIDEADDHWQVYEAKARTARKPHVCDECRRTIEPGERYERWGGNDGNGWASGARCLHCLAAAQWLVEVCDGFVCENVLDELSDHFADDPRYRTTWLGRVIVGMHRKWRSRRGKLLPVPGPPVYTAALAPHVRRRPPPIALLGERHTGEMGEAS